MANPGWVRPWWIFYITAVLFTVLAPAASEASDRNWTGTANTTWDNNANWTASYAGPADNGVFDRAFTFQPNVLNAVTVGGIWLKTGVTQNVTISGSATMTLQGNTINAIAGLGILVDNTSAYTLTVNAPITLSGAQTWRNSSGNTLTIGGTVNTGGFGLTVDGTGNTTMSGIISGTGSLTKASTGTVTLTATNSFTGATVVSGGTLKLSGSSGAALNGTSGVTVNSGGTLLLGANNQIKDTATITLAGGTFSKGNFSEGAAGTVGMGALTLTAAGSHIDFGTGTVGILNFSSFNPGGRTVTIDNWTGTAGAAGGVSSDRLIFDSDQAANLGSFVFTGYAGGAVEINLGGGFWEVVAAVPEPRSYIAGILAFGAIVSHSVFARRKEKRRSAAVTSARTTGVR